MAIDIVQHSQSFESQLAVTSHSLIFAIVSLILNSNFMPFATITIDIAVKVFLTAFILVMVAIHSNDTTATQDRLVSQSLSSKEELLSLQQTIIIVTATTEDLLAIIS